jgi:hypothetical protein
MPDHTHCIWCGAYLMGGATQHAETCQIHVLRSLARDVPERLHQDIVHAAPHEFGCACPVCLHVRALTEQKVASGEWIILDCECRTCGHRASSHIGGHCFECGREACWS